MNKIKIAVIIPAMGNCHQIPRKFVRSLNEKPLITYPIDLAKSLTDISNIIVINDDEEIDLIVRRSGIRSIVIMGNEIFPRLFGEHPTISLLLEIESLNGNPFDFVIWLGPSSPLLRKRDLTEAIQFLSEAKYDSVFSVSEEAQRGWIYTNTYQPGYREISNVDKSNVMHRETGAFFIMKRDAISNTGYIGKSASPFFLHESHSLEINSFNEWWIAEKYLQRKQILFVVSGYPKIGMGHVYRSLILAQEFSDHEVSFLCTYNSELAYTHISNNLYSCTLQNKSTDLLETVLEISPDIVINDVLDTEENYITGLKSKGIKVINFEDEGSGARHADLVINALYEKPLYDNMVVGHIYFSLRDEFLSVPPKSINEEVNNILITFGGSDDNNLTQRITKLMVDSPILQLKNILIITGPGFKHKTKFESYLNSLPSAVLKRIDWISNGTSRISEYMNKADLAVTSAGRTVYELTHLQIPSIVIAANERELQHTFSINIGLPFLGLHSNVGDNQILDQIIFMINNTAKRKEILKNLKEFDFSKGKSNLVQLIKKIIK